MRIKLYDCFKHWQEKGSIYVLGDTHFGDSDKYSIDMNWPTDDEHVDIINKVVHKNDCLIILGDVGDIEYVKKLKGYKILIMGNHDKGASNYIKKYSIINGETKEVYEVENTDKEFVKWRKSEMFALTPGVYPYARIIDNKLFDEVYEGPLFISDKIILSHEPIKLNFGINVYGHCHNGVHRTEWANENTMFNVASNVIGYTPMRLDRLIKGTNCATIHRQTIDKAIFNKKED